MIRKRNLVAVIATLALGVTGVMASGPANAKDAGSSPSDPIVVADPGDVPEGAVEDATSTYNTPEACDTTRSWVYTIPATDDVDHDEWAQEERTREVVPGQYHEAVTHQVYSYSKVVPGQHHDAVTHTEYKYQRTVQDTKTQYHFRKFTQTKEGTKHGNVITYGPYGPWTPWEPETHTSWEDSNAPLGVPEFHGEGHTGNTYWYRVWQAQFDGQTRTVPNGSHTETSDWLTGPPAGDGWVQIDNRTVTDSAEYTDPDTTELSGEVTEPLGDPWVLLDGYPQTVVDQEAYTDPSTFTEWSAWAVTAEHLLFEPVLPANTDTHEYRFTGPVSVHDSDGTPEVVTYYAYTDGVECEKPEGYEHNTSDSECVNNDLVTTNSTVTGTPVQAEDGSWSIVETATSSQSIEQNAAKCDDDNPPPPNPPKHHDTPAVPTLIDAGL